MKESHEASYIMNQQVPQNEVRCPLWSDAKHGICNKLLFKGEPSSRPQEFYCSRCKVRIIVRRVD